MKEYQSHKDVYFEVEKISDNKFIAKSFDNEFINEIHSNSYEECIGLMVFQIDNLVSNCNRHGIILRESIPDVIDPFSKMLENLSKHSILRKSHLFRLRNLVMNNNFDLIRDLFLNGKVFNFKNGYELGFVYCPFNNEHPAEKFLFVSSIRKCRYLRFLNSKEIIRAYNADDCNLTFEFTNNGSNCFLKNFHFEYCNFLGINKQGSLEIEKNSFNMYTYKIFNAEDLFLEKIRGYCVSSTYYNWVENFIPIIFYNKPVFLRKFE